jgi:NDP-sugar pyrophosphorylase family protein
MKKAVILAGGLGTRLKPFTDAIPKPLLPIGEKAILEIQIERLAKCGFDEVILATNYKADYIENFLGDGSRYGVKVTVSRESKSLGTAGPLKLLESQLTDAPFLVMNGDILTLLDFRKMYNFACEKDSLFVAGIKEIVMPYAFGNISFHGELVTQIEEKPDIITYALAGVYIMKPGIFRYIPADTYYGIDTLLQYMLKEKMPVIKYDIEEYWIDIGRMDDYERAQEDYKKFEQEKRV